MKVIRALIFDLCDTVARTAGVGALLRLPGLAERYDEERLENWFQSNPTYFAYERGRASTDEFLQSLRAGLGLDIAVEELAQAYEGLVLREIEGVDELLEQLHGAYPLYALSNNNPLLWRGIRRVCPSLRHFAQIFLSHEIGLLKPKTGAFRHVLRRIGCAPAEVALVDDSPVCVARARELGMVAVRFQNAGQVREALKGLLDVPEKIC